MFTFLSFVVTDMAPLFQSCELGPPHRFSVVGMNVDASAERGLKVIVVHFPSDDLCVGAFKVGFEHNVTGVGHEELADVGEDDVS